MRKRGFLFFLGAVLLMADGYIIAGDGSMLNPIPFTYALDPPVGPIHYKGNSYVITNKTVNVGNDTYLSVFKRIVPIPGGIPYFVELDAANRPGPIAAAQAFYPDSGGPTISTSWAKADGQPLSIQEFDLDTETWQPVVDNAGPTPSQAFLHRLVRRANGDWVIFYDTTVGPETIDVYWSKFTGAWSAGVRISDISNGAQDLAQLLDVALDEASGRIGIYWSQAYFSDGYDPVHKYLVVLSAGDALGTNYNWLNGSLFGTWETFGRPCFNAVQNQWELPAVLPATDFPNSNSVLGLVESGPGADPATSVLTRLVGGADVTNVAFPRAAVDQTAKCLYFLWANNYSNSSPAPGQMLFMSRPLDGSQPFPATESTDKNGIKIWIPNGMVFDGLSSLLTTPAFKSVLYDGAVDALHPPPDVTTTVIDLAMFSVDAGMLRAFNNPLCDFQYYFEGSAPPTLIAEINLLFCGVIRYMIRDVATPALSRMLSATRKIMREFEQAARFSGRFPFGRAA